MKDDKVIPLPTGYQPDELVPRSEIEMIKNQMLELSEEVTMLSKLVNRLLRELKRKSKT